MLRRRHRTSHLHRYQRHKLFEGVQLDRHGPHQNVPVDDGQRLAATARVGETHVGKASTISECAFANTLRNVALARLGLFADPSDSAPISVAWTDT